MKCGTASIKASCPVANRRHTIQRGSLGQHKTGYEELSDYIDFVQRVFPDLSNEIEEIISEGDNAFARLNYRGTHRAALFGIPPTGRTIQYAGAAVFKFRGDRIAEIWVLGDICGLVSQLKVAEPESLRAPLATNVLGTFVVGQCDEFRNSYCPPRVLNSSRPIPVWRLPRMIYFTNMH